jgi:hypothetical protein
MRIALLVVALVVSVATLQAQELPAHTSLPTRQELDSISARGIALWRYDRAAWEATDALLATDPHPQGGVFIVVHADSNWVVRFGMLSAAKDTFYSRYTASIGPRDTTFVVEHLKVDEADVGGIMHAARAVFTASDAFGRVQQRPYNHAVIPADNGDWLVYFYPAQTSTAFWPLGGDERFRISSDGTRILERHRMHSAILDVPLNPRADSANLKQVAFTHTAIVDNRPEDTDVFAVLSRDSPLPEYVGVKGYVYRIDKTGRITLPMKLNAP